MDGILLYGAGDNCKAILDMGVLSRFNVLAIIDKYNYNTMICGLPVVHPKTIKDYDFDSIIITLSDPSEIIYELKEEYGIVDNILDLSFINGLCLSFVRTSTKFIMISLGQDHCDYPYAKMNENRDDFQMVRLLKFDHLNGDVVSYGKHIVVLLDTYYPDLVRMEFVKKMHWLFPNSKFVVLVYDTIDGAYGRIAQTNNVNYYNDLKMGFDCVVTYNPFEAKKYGMTYLEKWPFPKYTPINEPDIDVFFVGRAKDRLGLIYSIYDKLNCYGLALSFWVYDIDNCLINYDYSINYNKWLSYKSVLKLCSESRCIIDLCKDGNVSELRYNQAVSMGKKLITNDCTVVNRTYFNSNNILVISSDRDIDYDWILKKTDNYGYDETEVENLFLDYIEKVC